MALSEQELQNAKAFLEKQGSTKTGIDPFSEISDLGSSTQEATNKVSPERKSRLSEMFGDSEGLETTTDKPQGLSDQEKEMNAMVASRKLEEQGIPQQDTYLGKIGAGQVSPIDPLARTGEAIGDVAAKGAQKVFEATESVSGVTEGREEFNRQAQSVGDFFNLNKYLPESFTKKIESGAATGKEVIDFLSSNDFLNLAVKDAMDASNVAPALAAGKFIGTPVAKAVNSGAKGVGRAATKAATGLGDETIDTLSSGNKFIKDARNGVINRKTLGESVEESIKTRKKDLSDTGSGYEKIRELDVKIESPNKDIGQFLKEKGLIKGDKNDLVEIESLSSNLTKTDISQINEARKILSEVDELNPNQILNLRNKLDDLSGFESGTTTKGKQVIKGIRKIVDDKAKESIPDLRKLDESFSSQIKELDKFERDFINTKTGELKDAAFSKVANSQKKGKELFSDRLEKLTPGISEKVRALSAVDDLTFAFNKPGTYFSSGIGLGGITTGNPALIAVAIASHPQVASRLIQHGSRLSRSGGAAVSKAFAPANKIADKIANSVKLTTKELSQYETMLLLISAGGLSEDVDNTDSE